MFNRIVEMDMKEIYNNSYIAWERIRGATFLVTGATGMIASYFISFLAWLNENRDYSIRIIGLVRDVNKAKKLLNHIIDKDYFSLCVQDITSPIVLNERVDYILHAASLTTPRAFRDYPVETITTNVIGSYNVMEYAKASEVKSVIYLSTREIYGVFDDKEFIGENEYGVINPLELRSCYPESKRLVENLLKAYNHEYDVPIKIARIAHTYGPGMPIEDGRVVSDFLGNVLKSEDITMNSDGSTMLALTYLSDVIAGLFIFLLNIDKDVCNISSKDGIISVRGLAELLCQLYPERRINPVFREASLKEKAGYLRKTSPHLNSEQLYFNGWRPKVKLNDGLMRTIAFYEEK